ncbi:uncharacterized protein LOC121366240 [Gigantopelta aegis]|uniref:uncharacterized protein LOC121366240 n=1 Tax=Gigantopelta aegis TaxID=1735272 RepID=UPI001B887F50|nr:uncharacterized protein LOC121366240 [Gigantopelta aegis]
MKTAYFFVLLLALTFVPEHVDGWFFRSVRRIRISPYHTLGCMAACKWARSWACKACKRKRGLDVPDANEDIDVVMHDLDLDGDGFVELVEIAHVTGLKMSNPILLAKFRKADTDGNGKLDVPELAVFHFENKKEFLEAFAEQAHTAVKR